MARNVLARPFARIVLLSLLLGLCALPGGLAPIPTARAATLNVCPSGCTYTTIQAALTAANNNDIITIGAGTYKEILNISKSVQLIGAGAQQTIIDGSAAGNIITIPTGNTVKIIGVTLRNGKATSVGGGAVQNRGKLTLSKTLISGNVSQVSGGGLYNNGATAELRVEYSTINGNVANGNGGGAIWNDLGMLTVVNSTLYGNQANGAGGGRGGSIYNNGGSATATILNSTIYGNSASTTSGGLYNTGSAITLSNTILAGNTGGTAPNCFGAITSLGNNIVGNKAGCTLSSGAGDQSGTAATPLDPKLAAPADNGGPTLTMAPLPGSPAIDAGNNATCAPDDQRTALRPLPQAGTCDIGAYELGLTTWYVAPSGDNLANNCQAPATSCKTLTEALLRATNGETIVVQAGSYTENLTLAKSVAINGAGAGSTTISGNAGALAATVLAIAANQNVAIAGVTISNGKAGPNGGGGIFNQGALTLTGVNVSGNNAGAVGGGGIRNTGTLAMSGGTLSGNTSAAPGGAILNQGTLTLNEVIINGNTGSSGGGIANAGPQATLTSVTIGGNTSSSGGGIENAAGVLRLIGSTFNANSAGGGKGGGVANLAGASTTILSSTLRLHTGTTNGGAIWNAGTLVLSGSTLNGNTATAAGGAIANDGASALTIANSTLAGNSAPSGGAIANLNNAALSMNNVSVSGNSAASSGGGIANPAGTVKLKNTLLAGNTNPAAPDCSGTLTSEGFNLLGNNTGCAGLANAVNGDHVGSAAAPLDPKLAALADNGGPTQTLAPLDHTSPAVDAGNNATCADTDQRGVPRPDGISCDIGAYELSQTVWYVAASGNNANTCKSPAGACKTIGAAIGKAADDDTISIGPGTYTENLAIGKRLTLLGAGLDSTAVDPNGSGTVVTITGSAVTISSITLRDGGANGITIAGGSTVTVTEALVGNNTGSGIINSGALILADSTVSNNAATAAAGGIANSGTATLNNSTISGNSGTAGGIANSGTATLNNSTISGNSAAASGGGISNSGTLIINNSTIAGNTAAGSGGGLSNAGGAHGTITGSSLRNNRANTAGGLDNAGSLVLINSSIGDNTAGAGSGGLSNTGTLNFNAGAITGNSAQNAGGAASNAGTLNLTNATLANNRAGGAGGGLANTGGTTTLASSTVSANSATGAGGGLNIGGGALVLRNTIVAGNTGGSAPDCAGTLTSQGFNLIGNNGGCAGPINAANGDQVGTASAPIAPKLDVLQSNGGATLTMALLAGSPAIEAGNPIAPGSPSAACPATDQRGLTRPQGIRCDIGAYEAENPKVPVTPPPPAQAESENNDDFARANPLRFDALGRAARSGTIASATSTPDIDIFSFNTQPGAQVTINLSNLPADYDIALLSDPRIPVADLDTNATDQLGNIADLAARDIASLRVRNIGSLRVRNIGSLNERQLDEHLIALATERGLTTETIDSFLPQGGTYYIIVYGFQDVSSPLPYRLDVTVQDGSLVKPAILSTPITDLASANADTAVKTIYLFNSARMRQFYAGNSTEQAAIDYLLNTALKPGSPLFSGADRQGVAIDLCEPGVGQCAATASGNPALQIDDARHLKSLYDQWDTNRRQPLLANEVAQQIQTILDLALRAYYRNTAFVVLVGGDDIIPLYRVPDSMHTSNESDYSQTLRGHGMDDKAGLAGSLFYHFVQTDNFYGDRNPTPWIGHTLLIPDLGVGRLVERPSDIAHYLRGYIETTSANAYTVDATGGAAQTLVTGYDFVKDQAGEVAQQLLNKLDPNGSVGASQKVKTLIGDDWKVADFTNAWFSGQLNQLTGTYSGVATKYSLTAINGHFDHSAAIPADLSGGLFSAQRLLAPTAQVDKAGFFKINGTPTLLYSIGCHSGLNVADSVFVAPSDQADFPQAVLKQGGNWIGNTGYGYGDRLSVGYSEQLSLLLTQEFGYTGATIGGALARAKLNYVKTSGMESFSVADEKVIEEMTLYGLPFIRIKVPNQVPAPSAPPRPIPPPISANLVLTGGLFTRVITVTNTFYELQNDSVPLVTSVIQDSFDGSTTISSQPQTRAGKPVLPMLFFDITLQPNQNATGDARPIPRGVRLKSATTLSTQTFNPRVTTLITDQLPGVQLSEAPMPLIGTWLPSVPYSFQRLTQGTNPANVLDTLLISPVQFNASDSTRGILRRFERMVLEVTYIDPATALPVFLNDGTPPTLAKLSFGASRSAGRFKISARANDSGTGIKQVSATYLADGSHWQRVILSPIGGGMYEANIPGTPVASEGYAFFEVLDNANHASAFVGKGATQLFLPLMRR